MHSAATMVKWLAERFLPVPSPRERERDLDSARQPALGSANEGRYVDDPVVQEMVHICHRNIDIRLH